MDFVKLGATDVEVPPLGTGTWAWGDRWMWGYNRSGFSDPDVRAAFEASLQQGIDFFDTAEVYGSGRSETLLGRFLAEAHTSAVIATKYMPYPWRLRKRSVRHALRESLVRLDVPQVDLYQVHVPLLASRARIAMWMEGMADAVDAGLVRAMGVSNFDMTQMGHAYDTLAQRDIPLASNQVHYSLLYRRPERDGVLQLCRDLGITLIAYSPLEMGLLTGKYTSDNPPPWPRGWRYRRGYLSKIQPLLVRMEKIGSDHGDKSPAQVALNWLICKGTVPIPGAKNAKQVTSNAGAIGWRLTEDEVAELSALSDAVLRSTI